MDRSVVNAIQASGELEADLTYRENTILTEDDLMGRRERPRDERTNKSFNIYTIIAAALIFISVIAVFEIIRLYMEHLSANDDISKNTLLDRTIGQIYYACICIVLTIIIIVIMKVFNVI